eukprot:gene5690-6274_t
MSNFRTLEDLNKKEEEEGKRNEYFAGGLDQRGGGSGLSVVGPPTAGSANLYDRLAQRAQQQQQEGQAASGGEVTSVEVIFYRNGFTVDGGPLRDLNAPENREFLRAMEVGEVPRELAAASNEVDVRLLDKRGEDYVAPFVAFGGAGATLGRSTSGGAIFSPATLVNVSPPASAGEETTVQVRTLDGKRLKLRVSTQATVLQLAALIQSQASGGHSFVLSAGYPPADLSDPSQTLVEAGLLGAAVTQKKAD